MKKPKFKFLQKSTNKIPLNPLLVRATGAICDLFTALLTSRRKTPSNMGQLPAPDRNNNGNLVRQVYRFSTAFELMKRSASLNIWIAA